MSHKKDCNENLSQKVNEAGSGENRVGIGAGAEKSYCCYGY